MNLRRWTRIKLVRLCAPVLAGLLLVLSAQLPSTAYAVEVAALYSARVALDTEAENPRELAYATALAEVLLRIAGSEVSADSEKIALLFPNPAAYVVQFQAGEEGTLWVSFDGEAIESMLRQTGLTVWGADRPLTLVWLAVDWGQGDREIITADDAQQGVDTTRSIDRNRLLRQRVLDMAERRGLPLLFPLGDAQDLQNVSFSDIWGGFDEQLLAASERYGAHSVLVGRIRPASGQRNRWSYYFGDEQRSWDGEPEEVIAAVADVLAAEFAVSGSAPLRLVDLSVSGIDSVDAYAAVQHMLAETSVIESFSVSEVAGDRVRYKVEARGGSDRLRRALRFNGLIEQNGFDGDRFSMNSLEAALEFFYSP